MRYCFKTKEGHEIKFTPVTDGSYSLEADQNTDGCIFGAEINDNGAKSGSDMCHVGLSTSSGQERVSHAQSIVVGLKNHEEAPEVDQDASHEVGVIASRNEL